MILHKYQYGMRLILFMLSFISCCINYLFHSWWDPLVLSLQLNDFFMLHQRYSFLVLCFNHVFLSVFHWVLHAIPIVWDWFLWRFHSFHAASIIYSTLDGILWCYNSNLMAPSCYINSISFWFCALIISSFPISLAPPFYSNTYGMRLIPLMLLFIPYCVNCIFHWFFSTSDGTTLILHSFNVIFIWIQFTIQLNTFYSFHFIECHEFPHWFFSSFINTLFLLFLSS